MRGSGEARIVAAVLLALAPAPAALAQSEEPDIPYVEAAEARQRLDLYLPAGTEFSSVLLVHGGSLTSGDRKEPSVVRACRTLVRAGVACAAVGYRLFPDVGWPAPAADVAAAFAWARRHVEERGGDRDRVFLVGHSSGCTLVTLVAADPAHLRPHALEPRQVAGVVGLGCRLADQTYDTTGVPPERIARFLRESEDGRAFGSLEALHAFVPYHHVGAHMPPYLAVLGEHERFHPPLLADAAVFVGAARDCGVDAEVVVLAGKTHSGVLEGLASTDDPGFRTLRAFLTRVAAAAPRTSPAPAAGCELPREVRIRYPG